MPVRLVPSRGVGTGPTDPAAAGPIICDKPEFLCSHHINFSEREMNRDRFFSLTIVVFGQHKEQRCIYPPNIPLKNLAGLIGQMRR